MQKRLHHEVKPDPIIAARGLSSGEALRGVDHGGEVRPCRDRNLAARRGGNPLGRGEAGLAVAREKPVKVGARNAEDIRPLAVCATGVPRDVLCKVFHARNVTYCDKVVKGGC